MKKVFTINMGDVIFSIEEDAHQLLQDYLKSIKEYYSSPDQGDIVGDIEFSISEKLNDSGYSRDKAINVSAVKKIMAELGSVEQFDTGDEGDSGTSQRKDYKEDWKNKKLYRDKDNAVVGGVCAGLAQYFGIDPVFIRLLFVLLLFLNGFGLWAYLVLWLVIQPAETSAEKLSMSGEPVNLKKIEETVRERSKQVADESRQAVQKWRKNKTLYKILNLPVRILEALFVAIKKIWQITWPVVRILVGVCLLVSMLVSFLAFSVAVVVFIFNIDSPLIVSDLPIDYLVHSPFYYLGMGIVYLLVIVPIILLFQLALTMIRNKNSFSNILNLILVVVWFAAVIFGSFVFTKMAPTVIEKIEDKKNSETIVSEFDFEDFDKIYVSANVDLQVTESPEFGIKAEGPGEELSRLDFVIEDGQLQVTQRRRAGWCFFCFDYQPEVEILMPSLVSYVGVGNSQGEVSGFAEDIFINLGEAGRLSADIDSQNIELKLNGVVPSLELEADPDTMKIETGGLVRLDLDKLDLDYLEITADNFSKISLSGTVSSTDIQTSGQSDVDLSEMDIQKISAGLEGNSELFLSEVDFLKVVAEDNARLEYIGALDSDLLVKHNAELRVIDVVDRY